MSERFQLADGHVVELTNDSYVITTPDGETFSAFGGEDAALAEIEFMRQQSKVKAPPDELPEDIESQLGAYPKGGLPYVAGEFVDSAAESIGALSDIGRAVGNVRAAQPPLSGMTDPSDLDAIRFKQEARPLLGMETNTAPNPGEEIYGTVARGLGHAAPTIGIPAGRAAYQAQQGFSGARAGWEALKGFVSVLVTENVASVAGEFAEEEGGVGAGVVTDLGIGGAFDVMRLMRSKHRASRLISELPELSGDEGRAFMAHIDSRYHGLMLKNAKAWQLLEQLDGVDVWKHGGDPHRYNHQWLAKKSQEFVSRRVRIGGLDSIPKEIRNAAKLESKLTLEEIIQLFSDNSTTRAGTGNIVPGVNTAFAGEYYEQVLEPFLKQMESATGTSPEIARAFRNARQSTKDFRNFQRYGTTERPNQTVKHIGEADASEHFGEVFAKARKSRMVNFENPIAVGNLYVDLFAGAGRKQSMATANRMVELAENNDRLMSSLRRGFLVYLLKNQDPALGNLGVQGALASLRETTDAANIILTKGGAKQVKSLLEDAAKVRTIRGVAQGSAMANRRIIVAAALGAMGIATSNLGAAATSVVGVGVLDGIVRRYGAEATGQIALESLFDKKLFGVLRRGRPASGLAAHAFDAQIARAAARIGVEPIQQAETNASRPTGRFLQQTMFGPMGVPPVRPRTPEGGNR